MVTVGVVIPCYNQGDTLERAVNSALGADEIVIVDDASHDDTHNVTVKMHREHGTIVGTYDHDLDTPYGVCGARNMGLDYLDTTLAIPLDADDYFLDGGLQVLRDAYEPGVFVYSDYMTEAGYQTAPPPGMITRKNITHATICYNRDDWQKIGGYDPDFTLGCEDWALTLAFMQAGLRPKHIPVATYYRTENPNGRAARCMRYAPLLKQLLKDKYPQVFTG